ncbi:hypothetical protein QE152_g13707 [Popillia japonica]|uniref:Ion transport domain-containing protein n=1 Tax=Popillia japonica TaxID=7064 RepID=A0AAW1LCF4_POPJA
MNCQVAWCFLKSRREPRITAFCIRSCRCCAFSLHAGIFLRYYWEVFMTLVLFTGLLVVPIHMAFQDYIAQSVVRSGFDFLFLGDIIITFNTGYQNIRTKKIVMDRCKVAVNYIKKWFILDLITCFNADLIIWLSGKMKDIPLDTTSVRLTTLCKLGRIFVIMRYLNKYRDHKQYSLYKFEMVKMLLVFVILLAWTTTTLFIVKRTSYLTCFWEVTNLFFLISRGDDSELHVICIEMACISIGVTLQLFFFAQLLQTVTKYNAATTKYHEIVQQLRDYMHTKDLPKKMMCYH